MSTEPVPDPAAPGAPAASAAPVVPRVRYRPRQRSLLGRVPVSVWILAPIALGVLVYGAVATWQRGRTVIEFVREGAAVPPLVLTVFPQQFSFATLSPPLPVAELHVDDGSLAITSEDAPEEALVRYQGDGVGTGYFSLRLGRPLPPVRLQPPGTLTGRVGEPQGVFVFGLRCLGLRAVAGARVIGLGGGEHGIVLCETTTDAEGRFELRGFDRSMQSLGVRVLQPGFALGYVDWVFHPDRDRLIVPLLPTEPIRGVVVLPDGVDPATLRVLAKGLPGVDTAIAADGTFVLDHVPSNLEPRLLLHGLAERYTHGRVNASPGQRDVRIDVVRAATVRGFVVDRATQRPLAGALVWHPHGPAGQIAVDTAADGSFVLPRVPPGEVVIGAQFTSVDPLGHEQRMSGEYRLHVEEGVDRDRILVEIE